MINIRRGQDKLATQLERAATLSPVEDFQKKFIRPACLPPRCLARMQRTIQ